MKAICPRRDEWRANTTMSKTRQPKTKTPKVEPKYGHTTNPAYDLESLARIIDALETGWGVSILCPALEASALETQGALDGETANFLQQAHALRTKLRAIASA